MEYLAENTKSPRFTAGCKVTIVFTYGQGVGCGLLESGGGPGSNWPQPEVA
jgi:hypothetical protein